MNKQQFISYVQHPETLNSESSLMLDGLVKEYPFFQTAHLLYAKNLFNQNTIQYSRRLKIAAAYSADRKMLYQLINRNKSATAKVVEKKPSPTKNNLEPIANPPAPVEVKTNSLIENIEQKVEQILEQKIEKLNSKIEEAAQVIDKRLTEMEQLKETKTIVSELKPPKDIQLVYSIDKELETASSPANVEKIGDLTKDAISKAIDASVDMQMSHLMYEEKLKKKKQEEAKADRNKTIDKNAVQPFAEWLKRTKRFETAKQVTRQQVIAMIDEFTRKQETEGVRPRVEFFSPENLAKKSVELDESIITETLAKILVKQKDYNKAIRAYEMLSLKYPEKSAFFAAQIVEIKKLKSI
ncbi:MAG: hypothetical protein IT235_08245 [Bacteroidia bacterium]|nr:hypothetical protein [Bacteroidia bacterium]